MEDHTIVMLFWDRSEKAVEAAADRYGGYCYKIALSLLGDPEDAMECVNDTWLRAWNAIPPARPQHLAVYLGKITRNLCLNRIKHRSTQRCGGGMGQVLLSELEDCLPTGENVETALADAELKGALEGWLREQPMEKRGIFLRRYFLSRSVGEIAREYGISESKVTSILHRLRKSLRDYLEKEGISL